MSKVHQLFSRGTSYSPDRLKVLGNAFDLAWQDIEHAFARGSPASIDAARTTLANVILSLPCSEMDDAGRPHQGDCPQGHGGGASNATRVEFTKTPALNYVTHEIYSAAGSATYLDQPANPNPH